MTKDPPRSFCRFAQSLTVAAVIKSLPYMSVVRKVLLSNYERTYHQCLFGMFSRKFRASKLYCCASLSALACGTWGVCCGLLLPLQTGSSQVCEGANPPEHNQILPPSTTNYSPDFNLNVHASLRKMSRKICDWRVSESRQRYRERESSPPALPTSQQQQSKEQASQQTRRKPELACKQPAKEGSRQRQRVWNP